MNPSISDDGRFVAFESWASNLVSNDTNGQIDAFVTDVATGETRRASVRSQGDEISPCYEGPDGGSCWYPLGADLPGSSPSISADGRFVAFVSNSGYVVPGDSNATADVFVYDRTLGRTVDRASLGSGGTQGASGSHDPAISGDGRWVAFETVASNLWGTSDTNGVRDVYVRDRSGASTQWVSMDFDPPIGPSHSPSISGNGPLLAFASEASPWGSDTNNASDIYEWNFVARTGHSMLSFDEGRGRGNRSSRSPSSSANGIFTAYATDATNLFSSDTNGVADIGMHEWAPTYSADISSLRRNSRASRNSPKRSGPQAHCAAGSRTTYRWHIHRRTHWHNRRLGRKGRHVHQRLHRHVRRVRRRHARASLICVARPITRPNIAARVAAGAALGTAVIVGSEITNRERTVRDCDGEWIYHYTDPVAAQQIASSGLMRVTPRFVGSSGQVFPPGAYGSIIPPVPPTTQTWISSHFYAHPNKT